MKAISTSSTLVFAITFITPSSKSGGVVSAFAVTVDCTPASGSLTKKTRSVKVPPTSVAARMVGVPAVRCAAIGLAVLVQPAGLDVAAGSGSICAESSARMGFSSQPR